MREEPWLDPRLWPRSNCSMATTERPLRARAYAVALPITPAPTIATSKRSLVILRLLRHVRPGVPPGHRASQARAGARGIPRRARGDLPPEDREVRRDAQQ